MRQTFVVYLSSSPRPINEILNPNLINLEGVFSSEFESMTENPVHLETLEKSRALLIRQIRTALTKKEKAFLISLKKGDPDYSLLPFNNLDKLPGIQWKLLNIRKMSKHKRAEMLSKLESILY